MKYVLLTGAYGGMGRKTLEALIAEGYYVIALDKSVGKEEKNVLPVQTDVSDAESVKAALKAVKAVTNELYAIVHFAGIYLLDSLVEIGTEQFERIFQINLFGAFLVNKTFLPLLKRGSRIVVTTSELAPLDPLPFTGLYAVTKGALDKYAYSLRMELQLLGISVSVLRAGAVDTGMIGASTAALQLFCDGTRLYSCNAERFKKIVDSVEAKRIPPERIAQKVVGMLSRKHSKFAYSINRNPLLLLLNFLPKRVQLWVIRWVLQTG